jgi:tryptophanyl-tRNA synthetase
LPSDPSPSNKEALKLGLFSYPVLQAADILLYDTTHVPVGEDQAQHIEFARDLADGFNHAYRAQSTRAWKMTPPQTILSPARRVMSLIDPTKKMSKSDPNPASRILITDSYDEIKKKINGARTDDIQGVSYDRVRRPGVSNLIDILSYMNKDSALTPEYIAEEMAGADTTLKDLKARVAQAIDDDLRPVRETYAQVMGSIIQLQSAKDSGRIAANKRAQSSLVRVKRAIGLLPSPRNGKGGPTSVSRASLAESSA